MLLATPGQTFANVRHGVSINSNSSGSGSSSSNNNSTINSNHTRILGRTTYRLIESTTQNNPALSSTTSQAAALMKTIAVRANRHSSFHSSTHSAPASSNRSNATLTINDVRRVIVANSNVTSNGSLANTITTTTTTNPTTSGLSSTINVNAKADSATTSSLPATTSTTTPTSSSTSSSSSKDVLSKFLHNNTVPPTELHRSSAARSRSYSIDSLYDEMCHFKPIRSVPTTPWKCGSKSRGATVKAPKACLGQKGINCDIGLNISRTKKKHKSDCTNAKIKIKPKLSANLFPHLKPHPSAFVRLLLPSNSYTVPTSKHRIRKRLQSFKQGEKTKQENDTKKSSKKKSKSKSSNEQVDETEIFVEQTEKVASKSKSSNTRKRKREKTQPKETKKAKNPKIYEIDRKTPPLTRGRIKMQENCKLYGPLA